MVRYRGQSYAIEVAGPDFDDPAGVGSDFRERHRVLYGFATEEPWELVSIRVRVSAPRNGEVRLPAPKANEMPAPTGMSRCTFESGEAAMTPRYDRAGLCPGDPLEGPVVVEDAWSTIVVPPGATLTADGAGHLHIATGAGP